jgi:hypothetical protein
MFLDRYSLLPPQSIQESIQKLPILTPTNTHITGGNAHACQVLDALGGAPVLPMVQDLQEDIVQGNLRRATGSQDQGWQFRASQRMVGNDPEGIGSREGLAFRS